jgi:predicted lipoprotein
MRRSASWPIALKVAVPLLLAAALFWFPPFRIVPLKPHGEPSGPAEFNATNFASAFWNQQLLKSLDRAADASQVLAALAADSQKARTQYGRKLGVSSSTLYFLHGTGHIVEIKKNGITVALKDGSDTADILLPTGLLFGNAVRDGTGLLDASSFPNSQNFNDLSTELNQIVETTVLPGLRDQAKVGAKITFTGCTEVDDEDSDPEPLKLVPVAVSLSPPK